MSELCIGKNKTECARQAKRMYKAGEYETFEEQNKIAHHNYNTSTAAPNV